MTGLSASPAAKINLALAVTGIREDGYHTLRSVFLRVALHDRLEVDVDADAVSDSLLIDGDLDATPDNLVLRAAAQLRVEAETTLPALRFHLTKRIPDGAGLGGGSSDAAAAMDLALRAWGVRLHPAARMGAALRLGADGPFFATGHGASLVSGIGEHLVPLPAPEPPAGLVLITPRERLSTAEVFAEYDRDPAGGALERVDEVADTLREEVDGATLAATTVMLREANDLWLPATRLLPGLTAMRDAAASVLGRAVLLTGSGSTLVAVYPSAVVAERAAATLQAAAPPELVGATIISTSTVGKGEDS